MTTSAFGSKTSGLWGVRNAVVGFFARPQIPDEDEERYTAFLEGRQAKLLPPVTVSAALIMIALSALDLYLVPDVPLASFGVRVAVVVPVSAFVLWYLLRKPRPLRGYYTVAALLPLLFGTLGCLVVSRSHQPEAALFMATNNLTITFAMLMLGLPPSLGFATGVALIASQTIMLATASFATREVVLILTTISVCTTAITFFGNWRMDYDRRRQFLVRQRDKHLVAELSARNLLLEKLSALDPLTGLSNRRGFDAVLSSAVREAIGRADRVVALAMVDVDHFKLYNDTQGHSAGDETLREIAHALQRTCGETDLAARFGGEEFVVVLPDVPPASLEMFAARLRSSVEKLAIEHPSSPTARVVTVSVGIGSADGRTLQTIGAKGLVALADAALYAAKAKGRNSFVVRSDAGPDPVEPSLLADAS